MSEIAPVTFDITDEKTYRWTATRGRSSSVFGLMFGTAWVFCGIPTVTLVVLKAIESLSQWASITVATMVTLVGCWAMLACLRSARGKKRGAGLEGLVPMISMLIVGTLTHVAASPLTPLMHGFDRAIADEGMQWIQYFFDNVCSVVLLDLLGVWEFQFSPITPVSWGAKLLTVFMRLLIAIGVVEAVVKVYRDYHNENEFFGTVVECDNWCSDKDMMGSIDEISRVAEVVPITPVSAERYAFTREVMEQRHEASRRREAAERERKKLAKVAGA